MEKPREQRKPHHVLHDYIEFIIHKEFTNHGVQNLEYPAYLTDEERALQREVDDMFKGNAIRIGGSRIDPPHQRSNRILGSFRETRRSRKADGP